MAVRRMAVLDENGVSINTILVDERAAGSYSPGYGAKLVDLGPAVNCEPDLSKQIDKEIVGLEVISVLVDGKPIELIQGDTLDLNTLQVTPRQEIIADPILVVDPVTEA